MSTAATKKTVLLDTNFLTIPEQFKVDIFSEIDKICHFPYELCVLPQIVEELKFLAVDKQTKVADRRAAKVALQLISRKGVKVVAAAPPAAPKHGLGSFPSPLIIEGGGEKKFASSEPQLASKAFPQQPLNQRKVFKSTDKAILDFAEENKGTVVVASQDRLLRKLLKIAGVPVLVLRQKRYVIMQ